jgi:hypothetical protein
MLDSILTNRATNSKETLGSSSDDPSVRNIRPRSTPRPIPSQEAAIYSKICVVCGFAKHQGLYKKYRISETSRAQKFLDATVFMQDEAFTRTCALNYVNAVFGADLYCQKPCISRYIMLYERTQVKYKEATTITPKQRAWSKMIEGIETVLSIGLATCVLRSS